MASGFWSMSLTHALMKEWSTRVGFNECGHCKFISFDAYEALSRDEKNKYRPCVGRGAYFQQCDNPEHKKPLYPWIAQLDVERVHQWMAERRGSAFALDELRELL